MTEAVTEPAAAKINPFLRVLGKREDGFHELETLILPITLADGVQAIPANDLRLTVVGERAALVPNGDDNLVLRAARALQERVDGRPGAHLLLSKRIPVAAGLGGGSADAAATLRALNDLWDCELPLTSLIDIGAEVGSDVPALIGRGAVIARGRGERIEAVELPRTWWVLVPSEQGISTADAYAWGDQLRFAADHGLGDLLHALARGDAVTIAPLLRNDLEEPVFAHRPDVKATRGRILEAGALAAVMCGSGPTVAGLARDGAHAEDLARALGGIAVASMSRP